MLDNIIYEYQKVNSHILEQYITNTPSLQTYFSFDFEGLKARQYCGIINYQGEDFYILPKIAKQDETKTNLNIFTYMLLYANNIDVKNEDLSTSLNHQSNNILEVFIQMFAKNLLKELQLGIYKEYITQQDNLRVLRGKYLINENLKYNFIKDKIYCEFDEFSMDNELNAFFLYAIKTLMGFAKDKKLLKMCELALDEVSFEQFDIDNLDIYFNRLSSRFKDSFEFALLLLQKSIPMFDDGKKSFAFLFDMDILFEQFIGKLIQSIEPTTKIEIKKFFGDLLLNPDIVIPNKVIIDMKYKIPNSIKDIKAEDRHQMYVYGNNFNIKNVVLLYPKKSYNDKEKIILGNNNKKINLFIKFIDLLVKDNTTYEEYILQQKENLIKIIGEIDE